LINLPFYDCYGTIIYIIFTIKYKEEEKLMMRSGWIAFEITISINHLRKYHNDLEEMIELKSEGFGSWMDEMMATLDSDVADCFNEFHNDEYWELKDEFPNTLRKSIFNMSYSYFEHQLKNICNYITKGGDIIPKKNYGSVIQLYRDYIVEKTGIPLNGRGEIWRSINDYRQIRNHLTHEYGECIKITNALEGALNRISDVEIKNYEIYLGKGFVEQFIDSIEHYLKYVGQSITNG
jgi:hypothetical protein